MTAADRSPDRASGEGRRITRRRALAGLGGLALAATAAACGGEGGSTGAAGTGTGGASTASATGAAPACVLSPEQTEGPYHIDLDEVRGDITEDREGAPLRLRIEVLDADLCAPLQDAAVEVWHADAAGAYSGVGSFAGETFLRGTRMTGADGVAEFRTIYPGWYPGRAVHVHGVRRA